MFLKLPPAIRKIILKIHLWLGLSTGLVVFIVAITGAMYCFAPELQQLTQPYRSVEAKKERFLPASTLIAIAEKQIPDKKVKRLYYGQSNKAAYALFFEKGGYYHAVFMNPYDGTVLKTKNMRKDFYNIILYLHFTLLIPYGQEIVGWCTLIFFVMIVSGIILWWPRNKAAKKARFQIKWGTSIKRLNYDLHNVLGFYASWVLIFIVFTGLIWAFDGFAKTIYHITGETKSIIQQQLPVSDTHQKKEVVTEKVVDKVWYKIEKEMSDTYKGVEFILPQNYSAALLVRANPSANVFYKTDYRYFDQYSAKEFEGSYGWGKYSDVSTLSDRIRRMNYDIHIGSVLGLPGRIAAFLAALIAASLPVTGFLIWQGKKKVKKIHR
ncbi:MAG: hypothetical protein RLZZ429_341 [Bacteroidota bacterium]